jgi:hydroxymethylpyrimidine pyrophosphatase-like HAD family hydrolase
VNAAAKAIFLGSQVATSYPAHRFVPPRSQLKWIALDHDGTMSTSTWSPENPTSEIGEPIWENVSKALALVADGFKLVVHTARPWADYEALESFYDHYDIPVRSIVCGKLLAVAYVDDRGIPASHPSWLEAVYDIIEGH